MIRRRRSSWAAMLLAALAACGGGGGGGGSAGNSATASSPTVSGAWVDFAISGLAYSTASASGTTSSTGGFTYRCPSSCETVTFKVGGTTLGSITGASTISLRDLPGGITDGSLSESTLRRAQFLITVDVDADAGNGIALPAELPTVMANRSLDFNALSFDADLASLVDFLRGDSRLAADYRAALKIPTRGVARSIAEQAEALARGVLVDSLTASTNPIAEVRKYVLRVPDTALVPYTGPSTQIKTLYPKGLRPAIGAGLTLTVGAPSSGVKLRVVTARGIAAPAPRYFDGSSARSAEVLVSSDPNGLPSLSTITLSANAAELGPLVTLRAADGSTFSGRPTPTDSSGSDGARNLDEALQPRSPEFDQRGLDPAGLAESESGTWVCDRRGPFLLQFDSQGRTLQRLGPAGNAGSLPDVSRRLPAILESRQAGLGCGGVAVRSLSGEVLLAAGAALDVNGRTGNTSRLLRLIGFNPRSGTVRQFGLPIRPNENAFRILDLESLSEQRMISLVRYRDGGPSGPLRWEIRVIDLTSASDLSGKSLTSGPNSGLALEFGTAAEIESSAGALATTTTLLELGALGWISEGAEGIARVDAQTLVVMGQANGGITSRIRGGDPALSVAEHQVDRNGTITPRPAGSTTAPSFELVPSAVEARQTLLWSLQLRSPLN